MIGTALRETGARPPRSDVTGGVLENHGRRSRVAVTEDKAIALRAIARSEPSSIVLPGRVNPPRD